MLTTIFILLIVFQFKHLFVDFIVQAYKKDSMKKFNKTGWFWTLMKHATDHGIATVVIAEITFMIFDIEAVTALTWLAILFVFDTAIHFTMDRIKASPFMLGRFSVEQRAFWISLGVDQTVHHLTHYAIIAMIVNIIL